MLSSEGLTADVLFTPTVKLLTKKAPSISNDLLDFARVETETGKPPNPWYNHLLEHTTHFDGAKTLGFIQDKSGKIVPVFSSEASYKSPRKVKNQAFTSWEDNRQVITGRLGLSLAFNDVSVVKGTEYTRLPSSIRAVLEQSAIPVSLNSGDNTSKPINDIIPVFVGTRVAVLTSSEGQAYIIDRGGKQYAIEIKGAGLAQRGFGSLMERGNHVSVEGGMLKDMSLHEHNIVGERSFNIAQVSFSNQLLASKPQYVSFEISFNGEQGIVFRPTQSTFRASYTGNEALLENTVTTDRLKCYNLCSLLISDLQNGRVHNSPHEENLVVTPDGLQFADDADYYHLAEVPYFQYGAGTFDAGKDIMNLGSLTKQYFVEMMNLTSADGDRLDFIKGSLLMALKNNGRNIIGLDIAIFNAQTPEELGTLIWEKIGAPAQFRDKLKDHKGADNFTDFIIERYLPKFRDKWHKEFYRTKYPMAQFFFKGGLLDAYLGQEIAIVETALNSGQLGQGEVDRGKAIRDKLVHLRTSLFTERNADDPYFEKWNPNVKGKIDVNPFYDNSVNSEEAKQFLSGKLKDCWN